MPRVKSTQKTRVTISNIGKSNERRRTTVPKELNLKNKDQLYWIVFDDESAFVSKVEGNQQ